MKVLQNQSRQSIISLALNKGGNIMYSIVYTKGNEETVIAQYEDLKQAKEEAKRLEKTAEYCEGFITVEQKTANGSKIF